MKHCLVFRLDRLPIGFSVRTKVVCMQQLWILREALPGSPKRGRGDQHHAHPSTLGHEHRDRPQGATWASRTKQRVLRPSSTTSEFPSCRTWGGRLILRFIAPSEQGWLRGFGGGDASRCCACGTAGHDEGSLGARDRSAIASSRTLKPVCQVYDAENPV